MNASTARIEELHCCKETFVSIRRV